ncbi:RNA 3'-terminal phosphate cyclase [Budviciaceae bacterium CWB-B4]|uniref:RNA 3'-terminal phosphate cyclase n=1 Tax=Limnobaculum xujianqingii TaxID=2738837 RepID=A0A9D7FX79_9GAMM|nr:RNA 3'-terminal phosphate cyclase [Limnobaculum xujianqingii]MBK5072766.1 RNA 3'-terminal phosphate cyclase [Limnobaculum xujianqingii]MBK5176075.1 RNA 3'-terminal phosphate cyclase [Limnobaculum xujianqingii]
MQWIEIDGSKGEGGGQILRSGLSLSMLTGKAVRFTHIRAGRSKPGIMRQHLTAILAAQQICAAQVSGATLNSTELTFIPGQIKSGDYQFDLGGAGSCALVLQTLLPALWSANGESRVRLSGGTHNPMAPSTSFLQQVWLPLMDRMGAKSTLLVHRCGFYPAGGGEVEITVYPVKQWQTLHLLQRGKLIEIGAQSLIADVPDSVARRELNIVKQQLKVEESKLSSVDVSSARCAGNALLVKLQFEHLTELFCTIGTKGKAAAKVAQEACDEAQAYLTSTAAVGEYLADQLLLPMAIAGEGSFTTSEITDHLSTNALVICQFLNCRIDIQSVDQRIEVTIQKQ